MSISVCFLTMLAKSVQGAEPFLKPTERGDPVRVARALSAVVSKLIYNQLTLKRVDMLLCQYGVCNLRLILRMIEEFYKGDGMDITKTAKNHLNGQEVLRS